jgi:hypothetical protein
MEDILDNSNNNHTVIPNVLYKTNLFVLFEQVVDDGILFHKIAPQDDPSGNTTNDMDTLTKAKEEFIQYTHRSITHYGLNPYLAKYRKDILKTMCVLENKLPMYNPFLSLRGFGPFSAYMHIYWNHLEEGLDYVGLVTSNFTHQAVLDDTFFIQHQVPLPCPHPIENNDDASCSDPMTHHHRHHHHHPNHGPIAIATIYSI